MVQNHQNMLLIKDPGLAKKTLSVRDNIENELSHVTEQADKFNSLLIELKLIEVKQSKKDDETQESLPEEQQTQLKRQSKTKKRMKLLLKANKIIT